MAGLLADLRAQSVADALVLSTCDRVEVIGAHRDPEAAAQVVFARLARQAGESEAELRRQGYLITDEAALRRLFGVAAALESQVIGEPQVLGQLKAAHRLSRSMAMVGPELEASLQAAYGAAKRARTETAVGERPVTLASAAIQLARDVHGDVAACSALLVGAGDMGELLVEHLRGSGLRRLAVALPSELRAQALAKQFLCHVLPFDRLEDGLADADIVVTALGSGRHVIDGPMMAKAIAQRRYRPVFVVDLGIPADVQPQVERIDGVFRYDLDDLEKVTMSGRASRGSAAAEAWAIVDHEIALFLKGRAERGAVPLIAALRRHFEIARAQALRQAGGDAARATELLVNRLLHDPSEALRAIAAGRLRLDPDQAERLVRALFRLDGEPGEADKENDVEAG